MSFLHAASECFLEKSKRNFRIVSRVLHLTAVSLPVISLVDTAAVCAVLDRSCYKMVVALMTPETMHSIDWVTVTLEHVSQLIPHPMGLEPPLSSLSEVQLDLSKTGVSRFCGSQFIQLSLFCIPLYCGLSCDVPLLNNCNLRISGLHLLRYQICQCSSMILMSFRTFQEIQRLFC